MRRDRARAVGWRNMVVRIHRGTHRIGGCITEIATDRARIIIDMGEELLCGDEPRGPLLLDGVTTGKPRCDGVFLTHYHGDHAGMYESVLPEVPVYMGVTSRQIYACVQRTIYQKAGKGNPERVENFLPFTAGKAIRLHDITVTPYCVDHSAFDAYMFLIEAEGKRVLHTGDFRMHGAKGRKMPAVYEKYARDIDLLITEGTMLSRPNEKTFTEHDLGRRARRILHDTKHVFVLCSATNIDTIAQFYHAALAERRAFVICEDDFQGEILRIVTACAHSEFYKFDGKIYVYGVNLRAMMRDRGFCFLGRANAVTQRAIKAFPAGTLVYSMWRGYLDKSHAAYDAYKGKFVEDAAAGGCKIEYLHTSGHACIEDIKRVCALTQAKIVVPVHCEQPEAFSQLGLNADVRVLQDGEEINC